MIDIDLFESYWVFDFGLEDVFVLRLLEYLIIFVILGIHRAKIPLLACCPLKYSMLIRLVKEKAPLFDGF